MLPLKQGSPREHRVTFHVRCELLARFRYRIRSLHSECIIAGCSEVPRLNCSSRIGQKSLSKVGLAPCPKSLLYTAMFLSQYCTFRVSRLVAASFPQLRCCLGGSIGGLETIDCGESTTFGFGSRSAHYRLDTE